MIAIGYPDEKKEPHKKEGPSVEEGYATAMAGLTINSLSPRSDYDPAGLIAIKNHLFFFGCYSCSS